MFFNAAVLDRVWYVDKLIQNWVNEINSSGVELFFQGITQLGSPLAFIPLAVVAFLILWMGGHIRAAVILNSGLIMAWVAMKFLKHMVGRERPLGEQLTVATGMSFPSGHAMLSLVFFGFLAYLLLISSSRPGKIAGYALMVVILLIGFSRIYLNVHYATDVAAGFILGSVILAIMIKTLRNGSGLGRRSA